MARLPNQFGGAAPWPGQTGRAGQIPTTRATKQAGGFYGGMGRSGGQAGGGMPQQMGAPMGFAGGQRPRPLPRPIGGQAGGMGQNLLATGGPGGAMPQKVGPTREERLGLPPGWSADPGPQGNAIGVRWPMWRFTGPGGQKFSGDKWNPEWAGGQGGGGGQPPMGGGPGWNPEWTGGQGGGGGRPGLGDRYDPPTTSPIWDLISPTGGPGGGGGGVQPWPPGMLPGPGGGGGGRPQPGPGEGGGDIWSDSRNNPNRIFSGADTQNAINAFAAKAFADSPYGKELPPGQSAGLGLTGNMAPQIGRIGAAINTASTSIPMMDRLANQKYQLANEQLAGQTALGQAGLAGGLYDMLMQDRMTKIRDLFGLIGGMY